MVKGDGILRMKKRFVIFMWIGEIVQEVEIEEDGGEKPQGHLINFQQRFDGGRAWREAMAGQLSSAHSLTVLHVKMEG